MSVLNNIGGSEQCKTCIHTKVCMRDKNILGDVFVPGNPMFFDNNKLFEKYKEREREGFPCEDYVPSAQKTGRWIPVKTRHMTDEERKYWEEHFGMEFDEYDAFIFDCPMPEDGQTVWLTTKNGYLFQDVAENDDGMCGLEGNGDWDDIVAWMPVYKPEPYKEDTNG